MILETRKSKIIKYIILVMLSLMVVFPLYFAILSSLKTGMEIFTKPFHFPEKIATDTYPRAIQVGNIGVCFLNSVFVTAATMIVTGLFGTMASYVLARCKFKSQAFWYTLFVAGLMIPIQSVIIPLSYTFGKIHLHDSYTMLILLYSAFQLPMTIFITTNFLKGIPFELEEAATIDGCSKTRTFFQIIVPLSIPGITTSSVFAFLGAWNNLIFPLIFVSKKSMQVIAIGLQAFFAQRVSDYGGVMAAIIISIAPPILAYVFLQEKVEKGMVAGAVKG